MATATEVVSMLSTSPLAGHLSATDADNLSVDMSEVGRYLKMLVEELSVLHAAVTALAERIDELAG